MLFLRQSFHLLILQSPSYLPREKQCNTKAEISLKGEYGYLIHLIPLSTYGGLSIPKICIH